MSSASQQVIPQAPRAAGEGGGVVAREASGSGVFSVGYRAGMQDFLALRQALQQTGRFGPFTRFVKFLALPLIALGLFFLAYPWVSGEPAGLGGIAAYADPQMYRNAFAVLAGYRRLLIVALLVYAILGFTYFLALSWAVWRDAGEEATMIMTLDGEGVESVFEKTVSRTQWREIAHVRVSDTHLFLLIGRHAGYVLPRRAVKTDADFAAMTDFAAMHWTASRS